MTARALAGAAALTVSAALALSLSPRVSGYADGAPAGFSGGFGEESCHACHFHEDLNSGPGRVTITDVPKQFAPGERYPVTVTLTRPGMTLGGFQLTARFKEDGAQAGTFAPAPGQAERVMIDAQGPVQYASQRRKGTELISADTAVWKLLWTAPRADGTVIFHVAANAANGDETAEGDYVHTSSVESAPGASSTVKSIASIHAPQATSTEASSRRVPAVQAAQAGWPRETDSNQRLEGSAPSRLARRGKVAW